MRTKALLATVCVLGAIVSLVYFLESRPVHSTVQAAAAELSPADYKSAKARYLAIDTKDGARAALAALRADVASSSSLARSCHAIAHEIGHDAFRQYKDFGTAMSYQDDICNSGYIHGVIESYFSQEDDVASTMKDVCTPYVPGQYLSWQCYHGVGHGLMFYSDNDLPKSLRMCDAYGEFARTTCVNGVFMENFNTDQNAHPTAYRKDDDLFYPCRDQAAADKMACYSYAPGHYLALHPNDYAGALKWCEGAEAPYRKGCLEGVGGEAVKENIDNPRFVENECSKGSPGERYWCIQGIAALYSNHFGSYDAAMRMCATLDAIDQVPCRLRMGTLAPLFGK